MTTQTFNELKDWYHTFGKKYSFDFRQRFAQYLETINKSLGYE